MTALILTIPFIILLSGFACAIAAVYFEVKDNKWH